MPPDLTTIFTSPSSRDITDIEPARISSPYLDRWICDDGELTKVGLSSPNDLELFFTYIGAQFNNTCHVMQRYIVSNKDFLQFNVVLALHMSKLTSDLPRGPSLSITVTKALYLAQYNPANTSRR